MWPQEKAVKESISEEQKGRLSARTSPGRNEADQWYAVWDILFPDVSPPSSPYLGSEVEEIILTVRELWSRNGPQALSNLHSTVSLDSTLSTTIQGGTDTERNFAGSVPNDTTTFVDRVLGSLATVSIESPQYGASDSAFWGAEPSFEDVWDTTATPTALSGISFGYNFGILGQLETWEQDTTNVVPQLMPCEIQPDTPTATWSPSSHFGGITDETSMQETGSVTEHLVGDDATVEGTKQEDGHTTPMWEEDWVDDKDLFFGTN
ncbi:hypothetical protein CGLO_03691 [Colletotrichum gloeosporioides Cg-14]|uniref:Uncharacterized protein n=1 Tax=Colletotrichum gloeosporioides (strain Cg-14) TaxID=1237896 RepID=T0KUF1_COLGC|nr:hypothetical protein CGLO_03691 [Colletotrichum gloeosporioides Cg-14]